MYLVFKHIFAGRKAMQPLMFCLLSFLFVFGNVSGNQMKEKEIISIKGEVPQGYDKPEIELSYFLTFKINDFDISTKKSSTEKVNKGMAVFNIESSESINLSGDFWGKEARIVYSLEPGESIEIRYKNGKPVFGGTAATKFELIYLLNAVNDSINSTIGVRGLPTHSMHLLPRSLKDYLIWNDIYNAKIRLFDALLGRYRNRLSRKTFDLIKLNAYEKPEDDRLQQFRMLISMRVKEGDLFKHKFGLTNDDLCAIYDSTLNSHAAKWLKHEAPGVKVPFYLYDGVAVEALRRGGKFFIEKVSDTATMGKDPGEHRYVARYQLAKEIYKNPQRSELLSFMFYSPKAYLASAGFIPEIEAILSDFYDDPTIGEPYKEVVRVYEKERRRKAKTNRYERF